MGRREGPISLIASVPRSLRSKKLQTHYGHQNTWPPVLHRHHPIHDPTKRPPKGTLRIAGSTLSILQGNDCVPLLSNPTGKAASPPLPPSNVPNRICPPIDYRGRPDGCRSLQILLPALSFSLNRTQPAFSTPAGVLAVIATYPREPESQSFRMSARMSRALSRQDKSSENRASASSIPSRRLSCFSMRPSICVRAQLI
jgi:hypothetical protein